MAWWKKKKATGARPLKPFTGKAGGAVQAPAATGALVGVFRPLKDFQCDETGGMYLREFTYKVQANEHKFKARIERWKELELIEWL